MRITRISPFSGKETTMDLNVTEEQMERFEKKQDLIQNIFPHLSAGEREFILTGITPEEWDNMFGDDEE